MNNNQLSGDKNKTSSATQQNADDAIAVNPNRAANNNITRQLNEMDDAEKEKASESLNDGEGG